MRAVVQSAHVGAVTAAAYAPDGKLATMSEDGALRVWSAAGKLLGVTALTTVSYPKVVAWDAASARVVVQGVGLGAIVAATGERDEALEKRLADADSVAARPGGGFFVHRHGKIERLDATGVVSEAATLDAAERYASAELSVSPDGAELVARLSKGAVLVFRAAEITAPPRRVVVPGASHAAAMGGGRVLVARTGSGDKSPLVVVDASGAALEVPAGEHAYVGGALSVSPSGRFAAALDDGVAIWADAAKAPARVSLADALFKRGAGATAFSRDGASLVAGAKSGRVLVIDASTGRKRTELGAELARPFRVAFTDDGALLVLGVDGLSRWSLSEGRLTSRLRVGGVMGVAHDRGATYGAQLAPQIEGECKGRAELSTFGWFGSELPEGARAAGTTRDLLVVDDSPAAPSPKAEAIEPRRKLPKARRCVAQPIGGMFSARALGLGKVLEEVEDAPQKRALGVRDLESGGLVKLAAPDGYLPQDYEIARGGGVVSAVVDRRVAVAWDAQSGQPVGSVAADLASGPAVFAAAASDDGALLAAASGPLVATVPTRSPGAKASTAKLDELALALTFRPRSREVLVGTIKGGFARVDGGAVLAHTPGTGESAAVHVAVDPTGKRAATVNASGTVDLWDVDTARHLATLTAFDDDEWIATTREGYYAASFEGRARVGLVALPDGDYLSFEQLDARLNRPDLLRQRLATAAPLSAPSTEVPPVLEILTQRAAGAELTLGVRARRGVARVTAYVEGRAGASRDVPGGEGDVTLSVPLSPGPNRVAVVGFSADGVASEPATLGVEGPAAGAAKGDLWVVAVGVARYPRLPSSAQLERTGDDARGLAEVLRKQAGVAYARVRETVIVDDARPVQPDDVRRALDGLAAMKPEDTAIVLLAGHGVTLGGGEMVFLTSMASRKAEEARAASIAWKDVAAALARARGRVLVLLDACHAGRMTQGLTVPNGELAGALSQDGRAGAVVFAAAKGRQLSEEATWNGVFTGAVLRALASPSTDGNHDGAVQLSELVEVVTRDVAERTKNRQAPWVVRRELFGDFRVAAAAR